ncbi:MAG TPA: hypothetical protein VLX32_00690 [Candidatus Acidoferrum sp.]|nr:hypothetical protein [Candidatus Acidoferrum sp.]
MTPHRTNKGSGDSPEELARRLVQALVQERVVPRFVDSYVVEHGRYGLQVHAPLYRDLLAMLQREALLAAAFHALEIATLESLPSGRGKERRVPRKGASTYRRKFLAALTHQQGWTAGDALDFQGDLRRYEELLARNPEGRRAPKAYEVANHPFVDRCAFMLDSSFLEKARVAASHALMRIEEITDQVFSSVMGGDESRAR